LTQADVANRIGMSSGYIGLLEKGGRHPSKNVLIKLADVLGLDRRELFFCTNPQTEVLVFQQKQSGTRSAWDQFSNDRNLRKIHNVSRDELRTLSQVALMGEVRSPQNYLFILNTIRHALGK
jgi:transcriptional regulator with XRE-family HTH domain